MTSRLSLAAIAILSISIGGCTQGISNGSPNIHVAGGNRDGPHLVFACDGPTSELETLFSQPDVIPDLKALNAGIALALPDLSPDRARIVRQLNSAGIPVTAWLALPAEQGYYLNASNAQQAATRFADFRTWTTTYDLRWAGVGLA